MLPAFGAPDWVLRSIIILAIVGLPITAVLAWVYDITDSGLEIQADATDTVVIPFGGRKTDFVVIGVLTIALVFSLYINLTRTVTELAESIEPISVLIADFDNQTGDPLFDESLEQALNIGLEGATFITAYRRTSAARCPSSNKWSRRSAFLKESFAHQLHITRRGVDSANDVSRWSFS